MIDLAVILAAGRGSRLAGATTAAHKALVSVDGEPLLVSTCRTLQGLGVAEIVVVTGYRGDAVRAALDEARPWRARLELVHNPAWEGANGLSVLAAAAWLDRSYLLLMADHLFAPRIAADLLRLPLAQGRVVLAVDRRIDEVYDLDDATKVRLEGDRITAIGKELSDFDAIDTGLFACSAALVPALRARAAEGRCSLSTGVQTLADVGDLRAFDIGDAWWHDIDTPGALTHARGLLARRVRHTGIPTLAVQTGIRAT